MNICIKIQELLSRGHDDDMICIKFQEDHLKSRIPCSFPRWANGSHQLKNTILTQSQMIRDNSHRSHSQIIITDLNHGSQSFHKYRSFSCEELNLRTAQSKPTSVSNFSRWCPDSVFRLSLSGHFSKMDCGKLGSEEYKFKEVDEKTHQALNCRNSNCSKHL